MLDKTLAIGHYTLADYQGWRSQQFAMALHNNCGAPLVAILDIEAGAEDRSPQARVKHVACQLHEDPDMLVDAHGTRHREVIIDEASTHARFLAVAEKSEALREVKTSMDGDGLGFEPGEEAALKAFIAQHTVALLGLRLPDPAEYAPRAVIH